jgi:hypothetical protein
MSGYRSGRKLITWPRVAVAIVIAVIAVVVVTAIGNINRTPHEVLNSTSSIPPVVKQQLQLTPVQQVENDFGKFAPLSDDTSSTPDTKFPAVLLIDDGSGFVSASQSVKVLFTKQSWEQQDLGQITNQNVANGYVTFQTVSSTLFTYTVKVGQAFVLVSLPDTFLVFDGRGKIWQTSTARALALRRPI